MTRAFLKAMGRKPDWRELGPDADAAYDEEEAIDLSALVPLAAQPHMPDRVVPVAELDGLPGGRGVWLYQKLPLAAANGCGD